MEKRRRRLVGPLKHWRVARGLSQTEAAQALGIRFQTSYSTIELGSHFPNMHTLRQIEERAPLPGLAAAYVCWFFDLTENELRTVLMSQATSGVVLV